MTTVKEFKDLGGLFVRLDKVGGFNINVPEHLNTTKDDDDDRIDMFAWRPLNTLPANPKFKYEIGGHMPQWRPLLDQPKKSAYDVDAHVSGEKVKPVFTQAMANAGELPLIGSVVQFFSEGYDHDWFDWCIFHGLATCGGCIIEHHHRTSPARVTVGLFDQALTIFKPIDTRTPKQKAVDEIQEVICSQGFLSKEKVSKEIAEKVYSAGYRKC